MGNSVAAFLSTGNEYGLLKKLRFVYLKRAGINGGE